jgi:DNA/RNA-binding domain of Phe-tRNA-synthetase-like protein
MRLTINEDIIRSFPRLRIGIFVASGIRNQMEDPSLQEQKRLATQKIRTIWNNELLKQDRRIIAWQETYKRFGAKPKEHRPTAEAFLRRIISGNEMPTINVAVDLYLLVETETLLPIGGYDMDKISGDIFLRYSPGGEKFIPLGAPEKIEETKPGEVVYADTSVILTRRWNYKDSDTTKITVETKNLVLFTEGAMPTISTEIVNETLDRLKHHYSEFFQATTSSFVADVSLGTVWQIC